MNDLEFKRHLKDLVHDHHHPEEHDWNQPRPRSRSNRAVSGTRAKPNSRAKRARRK